MPEIVLTTLNAKFIHSAFGLRYLYANLAELRSSAEILEFDINQRPVDIAERIIRREPSIVGIGVYIWNAGPVRELVSLLKKIRPTLTIVLGGPEVSYEAEQQELCHMADYVVTGEADLEFARLCRELRTGARPSERIIAAPLPTFAELKPPYDYYSDSDIAHRVLYVEASRGCPFSCEFCLSSLDVPVRQADLEIFLDYARRMDFRDADGAPLPPKGRLSLIHVDDLAAIDDGTVERAPKLADAAAHVQVHMDPFAGWPGPRHDVGPIEQLGNAQRAKHYGTPVRCGDGRHDRDRGRCRPWPCALPRRARRRARRRFSRARRCA